MKINRYGVPRLQILLIAVLLLGQCVLSGCNDSKPSSGDAVAGLYLRLETDFSKSEFSLGEPVIIHMYLRNNTDKDIVICAWPSREENLFIFYENDKRIPYKDIVTFDRPVSKDKSFVTIKSGAEIHYSSPGFAEDFGGKYLKLTDLRPEIDITHCLIKYVP
ncbi:MAG TPA: hypothetical protein ENH34_04380 [Phycisphaerales bacterium]|nr:hypothetical protein [Phycisphaerales bacterium]